MKNQVRKQTTCPITKRHISLKSVLQALFNINNSMYSQKEQVPHPPHQKTIQEKTKKGKTPTMHPNHHEEKL